MRKYVPLYENFIKNLEEKSSKELETKLKELESIDTSEYTFREKIELNKEINTIRKKLGIKTDEEINTENKIKQNQINKEKEDYCINRINDFFDDKININIYDFTNGGKPLKRFKVNAPLYRGQKVKSKSDINLNNGMAIYGNGIYTTTSRKYASTYGKVITFDAYNMQDVFPQDAIYFNDQLHFNQFEYCLANELFGNNGDRRNLYITDKANNIDAYLKHLGYDGIIIKSHDNATVIVKFFK